MVIQPAQYPALIKIIDREYTDGLDRILSAQLDDEDRIVAYAQDGNKRIRCEISDTQIRFRLLLPGESVQFAAPTPNLVDAYVDKMLEIDSFKPWLLQAKELLMQSSDLDEYAEKLIDLYPEMPSNDFVATMRDAMTAASLGGYFDASEDDGLDGELEFKMLGDEGINLLIDSMFDDYTLESIQLDAVASLL